MGHSEPEPKLPRDLSGSFPEERPLHTIQYAVRDKERRLILFFLIDRSENEGFWNTKYGVGG